VVGRQKRDPQFVDVVAPASAYLQLFGGSRPNDEPHRIQALDHAACGLPALGCLGRTKASSLNKDGSFQRTAKFRGPDLDSAVPAELVGVAGRLNNALRRLGSGLGCLCRGAASSRQQISRRPFP